MVENKNTIAMTDIYLSHAPDDRLWAGEIAGLLENAGYTVWREVCAIPGEDLISARRRHRGEAKCVLVMWPEEVVAAQWVEEDYEYGQANGNVACVARAIEQLEVPCPDQNVIELGQSAVCDSVADVLFSTLASYCEPSHPSVESAAARSEEIMRRREEERRRRAEKAKADGAARKFRQRSADQSSEKHRRFV